MDCKICATFIMEIPTFHTHGYYGIFKPSLDEVIAYLPEFIFTNGRQLYIATSSVNLPVNDVIIGDYHFGVTTVWLATDRQSEMPATDGQTGIPATDGQGDVCMDDASVNEKHNDTYNEDVCMICLTAKSNTMVEPCNHVVVCTECSKGLAGTHDKNICVKCRRQITNVIYP